MIEESQKFDLKDLSGKKKCSIFADPKKTVVDGVEDFTLDSLRFRIGDEEAIFSLGDIRTILFALSDNKAQRDMLPIQMVTQRKYQTVLGVKADRDIKKGEMVKFKVDIPLPPIEKEIAQEAARQLRQGLIRPADLIK